MYIKTYKIIGFLTLSGLICALILFAPSSVCAVENTVENMGVAPASDKTVSIINNLSAGFYQFNKLEIFIGPNRDDPPATIETIQKYDISCFIYENGKTNQPIPCVFKDDQDNRYMILIDKETILLGVNQESASLTDFQAGDKINVLGRLSADSKNIRAEVIRNLEEKDYHQSLFGTIKEVRGDGFTITLANGDEVFVKTPIVKGAQVTVKGVFDKVNNKVNNVVSNVLSIFIKPYMVLQETPTKEPTPPLPPTPSANPSTLFKNFLNMFIRW